MNVIIFDTETIGARTQDLLNIGYKIVDMNPSTGEYIDLCNRDYLVRKLFKNEPLMMNDFFMNEEKYLTLQENVKCGGTILRNIEQIFQTMSNDIARYHVLFGYAYNCDFDIDKFSKTALKYGIDNPLAGLPIFDIWAYAYAFICTTKEYQLYCEEHNKLTESERFFSTNAETVYSYIINNPDFKESHTALSDACIETAILSYVVVKGCDITKKCAKPKSIPSGKIFKTIIDINGEQMEIEYTKKIVREKDQISTIKFYKE